MLPLSNLKDRVQEFFTYTTGRLAAIGVGATINTVINIQAEADFILEKLTYSADLAGVAQTWNGLIVPNVTVLLTATGSGNQLMNAALPLTGLFGSAFLPFILPYPRVLRANSQLQIQLVSFEAAVTPLITLNFHGRKVYNLANNLPTR
jgi:hypothetical protein